jgi:hypothetical protein
VFTFERNGCSFSAETRKERETSTQLEHGRVTEPSIAALTEVNLQRVDTSSGPIWSDTFEYRAPLSVRREDVSILFSPGSLSTYLG